MKLYGIRFETLGQSRYRYVVEPDADLGKPLSECRLLAANKMRGHAQALRLDIPHNERLENYNGTGYAVSSTPIEYFDPTPVVRVNGRFRTFPDLLHVRPAHWAQRLQGIHGLLWVPELNTYMTRTAWEELIETGAFPPSPRKGEDP